MGEKFSRWAIFSVTMALVPLGVSALIQATHGLPPKLESTIGHGELLLITAALCARSAGELFGSGADYQIGKIIAGGATLLVMLIAAIYFAHVAASHQSQSSLDLAVVCGTCLVLFGSGFFSGLGCVLLSQA